MFRSFLPFRPPIVHLFNHLYCCRHCCCCFFPINFRPSLSAGSLRLWEKNTFGKNIFLLSVFVHLYKIVCVSFLRIRFILIILITRLITGLFFYFVCFFFFFYRTLNLVLRVIYKGSWYSTGYHRCTFTMCDKRSLMPRNSRVEGEGGEEEKEREEKEGQGEQGE